VSSTPCGEPARTRRYLESGSGCLRGNGLGDARSRWRAVLNVLLQTGVRGRGVSACRCGPSAVGRPARTPARAVPATSWLRLAAEFQREPLEPTACSSPDLPGHRPTTTGVDEVAQAGRGSRSPSPPRRDPRPHGQHARARVAAVNQVLESHRNARTSGSAGGSAIPPDPVGSRRC
jgi:hypothetical protein